MVLINLFRAEMEAQTESGLVDTMGEGMKSVKMLAVQWCLTACNPMDCSPPGSSVHGISQARILEWVAILFSRESSLPRNLTWVSCIISRFFTI